MGWGTDVFVIGAGPAGLAAAIAVREKGFAVTVADGAHPPIDKACGEGLLPETLGALCDLGVRVSSDDGYAFRGIRFIDSHASVAANFPDGPGLGLRRPVLHKILLHRAIACGVRILWDAPVKGLTPGGVLVGGSIFTARWIIGADGSGSRVRRWSNLDAHRKKDLRYACRRHYRVPPWSDCMEIYWGREMQAYVTPVAQQEICAVIVSRNRGIDFDACMRECPQLAGRLAWAEMVSRERGAVTAMHTLERVYRGNVALIGDASGSVDAITGEGLRLSFQQAIALADALQASDLSRYQIAHQRLGRRSALLGRLLLLLGRQAPLRDRTVRALSVHPRIFARLLVIHGGEPSATQLAATGALLGWRILWAQGEKSCG